MRTSEKNVFPGMCACMHACVRVCASFPCSFLHKAGAYIGASVSYEVKMFDNRLLFVQGENGSEQLALSNTSFALTYLLGDSGQSLSVLDSVKGQV